MTATHQPKPTMTKDEVIAEMKKTPSGLRPMVLLEELDRMCAALREIEKICTESNSDCRKRMGTRVGNCLVIARKALSD